MGKEVGFGIGELKVRGFCRRPARSASHRVDISRMDARTLQVPQLDRTGAVHTTRIVEITDPEGWGER